MVETKGSKTNTIIIISAVAVILLLLLVIAGNYFSPKNNIVTTPVPKSSGDDTVSSLLTIITAVAFVSAIVMAYYYFFKKNEDFNNEIALALIRTYAYKHCNRLFVNDNLDNMFVEFFGNSVFYYFKDVNTTFRLDRETKFISHNRVTLVDAVRQVERSELLRNVVSGSSLKDVLLAELQKKGVDRADAEKQISKIESNIMSG